MSVCSRKCFVVSLVQSTVVYTLLLLPLTNQHDNDDDNAAMGARRHGNGREGGTCPPGNVVKCLCALVVTVKRS